MSAATISATVRVRVYDVLVAHDLTDPRAGETRIGRVALLWLDGRPLDTLYSGVPAEQIGHLDPITLDLVGCVPELLTTGHAEGRDVAADHDDPRFTLRLRPYDQFGAPGEA